MEKKKRRGEQQERERDDSTVYCGVDVCIVGVRRTAQCVALGKQWARETGGVFIFGGRFRRRWYYYHGSNNHRGVQGPRSCMTICFMYSVSSGQCIAIRCSVYILNTGRLEMRGVRGLSNSYFIASSYQVYKCINTIIHTYIVPWSRLAV